MVYYPIQTLVGRRHPRHHGRHRRRRAPATSCTLLGIGRGVRARPPSSYAYQEARAASPRRSGSRATSSATTDVVVVLGDNILEKPIAGAVGALRAGRRGARASCSRSVHDPQRFGVAARRGRRRSSRSIEKPKHAGVRPRGDRRLHVRQLGARRSWSRLQRSDRGELEITDVNNAYLRAAAKLQYEVSTAGGPTRARSSRSSTRTPARPRATRPRRRCEMRILVTGREASWADRWSRRRARPGHDVDALDVAGARTSATPAGVARRR